MSDNEQQLVFLVDFLDLLSECLAPLKPLAVLGVWVLLPDQGGWMEELDQGRNDGPNTVGLLSGCHFWYFWHVLGDVSQHDTTIGWNFRLDALVKPRT